MKEIKEEELIIKALPKLSRHQIIKLHSIIKGMIRYNLHKENSPIT